MGSQFVGYGIDAIRGTSGSGSGNISPTDAVSSAQSGLQDIINLYRPQLEAQQGAIQSYQDILSGATDITQMPGYQAGMQQGQQAISSSAAARGMQLSGLNIENLAGFGSQYYQSQRQQALNEIAGLAGITAPAMQATTQAMGEQASLPMQQLQMQLAAQQGRAASQAGTLGGIGSILGGIGMLAMSDIRTKQNIEYLGEEQGIHLYKFEYKPEFKDVHGHGTFVGVMAQEVIRTHPEAVHLLDNGYMAIDYSVLFGDK